MMLIAHSPGSNDSVNVPGKLGFLRKIPPPPPLVQQNQELTYGLFAKSNPLKTLSLKVLRSFVVTRFWYLHLR
jgi:hypothetical protein